MGGYIVEEASVIISLRGERNSDAVVTDDMRIIGTRDNVVLLNKVVEHPARVTNVTSNHRFVSSSDYADVFRMAALFDAPYVQIGTREHVRFVINLENGFSGDHRRWDYDIAVETSRLSFELRAPKDFAARVRLARYLKPTDHDLQILVPELVDGIRVYRATVTEPETGAVYAKCGTRERKPSGRAPPIRTRGSRR